jgi:serine/threonine-protein kinase RIM15
VNRRSSRILVDDPVDPIMTALYDIISVATDVTEMTLTQLTAQPKICEALVQRVQNIGKAWDEHPDWHGRNWYVQVLLAVASLSRVVEWWEAEKQFWNFDENDDEEDEPLTFVTKPAEESQLAPPAAKPPPDPQAASLALTPDDENKLRLARPSSQGRKSRDEHPKNLAASGPNQEDQSLRDTAKLVDQNESARVLATERLRLQAEMAQNQNIVVELGLDGDHVIWANYAWKLVVGYVPHLTLRSCQLTLWIFCLALSLMTCLVLGYHTCSLPMSGECSRLPLSACGTTIRIPSRSGSRSAFNRTMTGNLHAASCSSRWKVKECS